MNAPIDGAHTQRVSTEHIPSRPHVEGSTRSLHLRPSAQELTDGAGLLVLRRLWDELDLGSWIEAHTAEVGGWFSYSLMVEVWTALLWYGGGWMDDLELMARRGVRRLFGWKRVPDPTTFGRWVRRAGAPLLPVLDQLIRRLVRIRWTWTGVPQAVTLVLDSTVAVRYGRKQAGAEVGTTRRSRAGRATTRCWPSSRRRAIWWGSCGGRARRGPGHGPKRGCPSWWAGSGRPGWRRSPSGSTRASSPSGSCVPSRSSRSTTCSRSPTTPSCGASWARGARASAPRGSSRRPSGCGRTPGGSGATGCSRSKADAWRAYNAGAVVEQRIEELGQLSVGQTAVDDPDGNRLLWALGGLAYQLLHTLRSRLPGPWRVAQPKRLRTWLFRLAGRFTASGDQWRLDVPPEMLGLGLLSRALGAIRGPPSRYAY